MIEKLISPREPYQPYIWYADYGDNNVLTEFEQDGKENKFEIIDKIKLKEFGLFGKGLKLFYNVDNGIFTISRNIVKFHIELEDGRIINLYDQYKHYNDPILFRHFYSDFNPITGKSCGTIDGYFFGYKYNFMEADMQIHHSTVFALMMKDTLRFGIHLMIDKPLKGFLVPVVDGRNIEKIPFETDGKEGLELEWKFIF